MANDKTVEQVRQIRCWTVRLITYSGKSKKPVGVGTGVALEYGSRGFVVTNTHVLETFYDLQEKDDGSSI